MPWPSMQRVMFLCSMVGMKAMQFPVRNVPPGAGNNVVSNSTSLEASYLVDESGLDSSTSEPNTQTAELTVESDAFRKPANPHRTPAHPPPAHLSPCRLVHRGGVVSYLDL